ncbi:MAG: TPM domain-containing protein [Nitrospirae bacterium]|nr:TPM domain-containing protein [Nitrospirota bacterium]
MRSIYKFPVMFLLCLCLSAASVFAEVTIPDKPYNHVVDLAGIISDDVEGALNGYLLELEQKTTAQMVVLTIGSLEGGSLEDLSISIAHNKWKLGQKGKDNGVLLLVSLQDRKYRFEIGYGLEGVLPDSLTGTIGRQYLVPYFRQGDYSTGIYTATLAVIHTIAADASVEIAGMPKMRNRSASRGRGKPSLLNMVFAALFFIGLIYMFIRHPRLLLLFLAMNMLGGGRRSGWGGGGGFSSGSFGGGGGGGFGGGGSSGSW